MKTAINNTVWECHTLRQSLLAVFGYEYGEHPESRLDEIRRGRANFATTISRYLAIGPGDVAVDLGSGIGLQAEHIAPGVKQLHCIDISQTLLAQCRQMVGERSNVEYHLVPYGDLSTLVGRGVTKVYSTAVFIHFNVYDLWLYLVEIAKILEPGGLLGFDFANGERIGVARREWIDHAAMYQRDRHLIQACINYHGLATVKNLLVQAGFECVDTHDWADGRSVFVIARRC